MTEESELDSVLEAEPVEIRTNRVAKIIAGLVGLFIFGAFCLVGIALLVLNLNQAPDNFPINQPIPIEAGTDVKAITEILEAEGVVRSASLLYYAIVLFHDPTTLKASTYIFNESYSTYDIAAKLVEGDFDTDLIRITFFEGERATQYGARARAELFNFDLETFNELAIPLEGKLFPDTYFIPQDYSAEQLITLLSDGYVRNTAEYAERIANHPLGEQGVLTLASIIEREANSSTSKKMVAGVFFNRLDIDMALQADATIEYVLDRPINELRAGELAESLEEIDSPYNTYLYPGLPPTPIGNPGLDSIEAVLQPTYNDYFFYITGNDGVFYYAETYDQHLTNIQRHLR